MKLAIVDTDSIEGVAIDLITVEHKFEFYLECNYLYNLYNIKREQC